MHDLNAAIAENLKIIRRSRQLSLDNVASMTNVSKSMLGQIERLEVNPTVTTIWKIANGLRVSFTSLIQTTQPESELVESIGALPLDTQDGKYHLYPLFLFNDRREFDIYRVVVNPGGLLESDPHQPGTHEYIMAFKGELTVTCGGKAVLVGAGQAFRFCADSAHSYENRGSEDAECYMMLSYGNS